MTTATRKELLTFQRLERELVALTLAHPEVLDAATLQRLRYLLNFARLTRFEPRVALGAPAGARPDVAVRQDLIAPLRARVLAALAGSGVPNEGAPRVHHAGEVVGRELPALDRARRTVLFHHAEDFSARELDAEVGNKVLVNVNGGGGGCGYVYIGAWRTMDEAGLPAPAYLVGSSIGALLGAFRAVHRDADYEPYLRFAVDTRPGAIFRPPSAGRRHGVQGLLDLDLRPVDPYLCHADGTPKRIRDMEIPYDVVVAGVRRTALDRLQREGPVPPEAPAGQRFSQKLAWRMVKAAGYVSPLRVKGVVLGADDCTREFNVRDAMGFSSAIPGVLHYEAPEDDARTHGMLGDLRERHGLSGIVDGGAASNVPVKIAWKQVQEGRIGTRNAFYLAFDSFAPQFRAAHAWLAPVTAAIQLQQPANRPYTDAMVKFSPTLSAVNLLPNQAHLDQALAWGEAQVQPVLPLVQKMLEPVVWVAPSAAVRDAA